LSGLPAKVHRTRQVQQVMPPLLLELWREQHPHGNEQTFPGFNRRTKQPQPVQMFPQPHIES